jgi:flagellar assembly factor FliW
MIGMNVKTRFFGEIEIQENRIIYFDRDIPGLEEYRKFILLDITESNLKCLQSIDEKELCLILISPWDYFKDYEIELSDDEMMQLGIKDQMNVAVYNPVTIRENKITANLVAPIIINIIKNTARQIILQNTKYCIRQEIPCLY